MRKLLLLKKCPDNKWSGELNLIFTTVVNRSAVVGDTIEFTAEVIALTLEPAVFLSYFHCWVFLKVFVDFKNDVNKVVRH